jgi:hypothetical protein
LSRSSIEVHSLDQAVGILHWVKRRHGISVRVPAWNSMPRRDQNIMGRASKGGRRTALFPSTLTLAPLGRARRRSRHLPRKCQKR